MAQGFLQKPGIDYEETYSPVMDITTFRYLISLAISQNLEKRLMDVVTAYLYGDLDTEIHSQKDFLCLKKSQGVRTQSNKGDHCTT